MKRINCFLKRLKKQIMRELIKEIIIVAHFLNYSSGDLITIVMKEQAVEINT